MKKSVNLFIVGFLMFCLSGSIAFGWSLLEDFQMRDVVGEEGVCFAHLKQECGFDTRRYGRKYPDNLLVDDMDEIREQSLEKFCSLSLTKSTVPSFPESAIPIDPLDPLDPFDPFDPQPAVMGDPFFSSSLFSPDMIGWNALADQAQGGQ